MPDRFTASLAWCARLRCDLGVKDSGGRKCADAEKKNELQSFVQAELTTADPVPLSTFVKNYKKFSP